MKSRKVLQVIVALSLLNVWLVRAGRRTPFRGGDAESLKEEFARYGLPPWSVYGVGLLKVGGALGLLAGLRLPSLVRPAASLISLLMGGAVSMHVKIRDPWKKAAPALVLLFASLFIRAGGPARRRLVAQETR